MPASTGTQGRKETSQRGVIASICARVFVALASWRAAGSLNVLRSSMSSGIKNLLVSKIAPQSRLEAM
jgi:hypothetical protein